MAFRGGFGRPERCILKEKIVKRKIVLEPFDWEEELRRVKKIAREIGKKWPKGLTSVDLIRKERRG